MTIKVTYDADSDVLYVSYEDILAVRSVETEEGAVLRFGAKGQLVGITLLDFTDRLKNHSCLPTE